ncbi:MAG: glycolate oxidase subunit GlcE, partial [Gammaproteobacteria bacterium]
MKSKDLSQNLTDQVNTAINNKTPLVIVSGNSKAFYGNQVRANTLDVSGHQGIIEYQPSELVVTVRSGTLLSELEAELKANKQKLAFEPPQHSAATSIGGVVACGLSGPGRPAYGSARDFVLGATTINGKAEKLRFGGQVMKNVAGYDASRLMVGAQGTLGVILDLSLKV